MHVFVSENWAQNWKNASHHLVYPSIVGGGWGTTDDFTKVLNRDKEGNVAYHMAP